MDINSVYVKTGEKTSDLRDDQKLVELDEPYLSIVKELQNISNKIGKLQ